MGILDYKQVLRGAISAQRTDWQIGLTKGKISLKMCVALFDAY